MATRIFMSAGEPSGVWIGAALMRTLKERLGGDVTFAGLGGPAMVDEGLDQIFDPARSAAMWLWGNLKRIPSHRRALQRSIESWRANRPDVVVTIDYQAFHLYVGAAAKELGIPVVHFVGSQFWARRFYKLKPLKDAFSHVLLIHEFEEALYKDLGMPATFVGHPLFERMEQRVLEEATMESLRQRPQPRLGLLPGSRGTEIQASLPVMLEAARALSPVPRVAVSVGRPDSRDYVASQLAAADLDYELVEGGTGEILSTSDIAIVTSGSVTMECVYYLCPSVVMYRLSPISYFFAKPQVACPIAQPNLIAGRNIVPEFLLGWPTAKGVTTAAQALLDSADARDEQRKEFGVIRERLLAGPAPSEAAADVVLQYA